jgi:hypothetical protein
MYVAMVILLMAVLPIASIAIEFVRGGGDPLFLIGKWFVFWSVGARLVLAGVRQVANPEFTAGTIFGIEDKKALVVVQELGFANLSIGALGLLSLLTPAWVAPAAIAGGLYYGLAGLMHALKGGRNGIENVAMISDLFLFVVLAIDLAGLLLRHA